MDVLLNDSSLSYPKLKIQNTNSYYSGLLANMFAGAESETSCFLQFRYQFFIYSSFYEEIANAFKKIAEQDLKHQELLAKAIIMFGKDPSFTDSSFRKFNTRSINYIKNIEESLALDIEMKEKSVIDYKVMVSKISNYDLKVYLERILLDEQNHLKVLQSLKNNIK